MTSANLNHGTTLKAETKLEGKTTKTKIVVAKTFATPSKNTRAKTKSGTLELSFKCSICMCSRKRYPPI